MFYLKIKDENPSIKYKANESTSRHNPKNKNKKTINQKNKNKKMQIRLKITK